MNVSSAPYPDVDKLILETPISQGEFLDAIMHLKSGKDAGPDNTVVEMIKRSKFELMSFLNKCFNRMFDWYLPQ